MLPNMMRWIATLLTMTLLSLHSPLAWSSEARRAPPTGQTQTTTQTAPPTAGSSERKLSEKRRAELIEREKQNGNAEEYDGGVAIYIGSGVLLVALIIVGIIVIAD